MLNQANLGNTPRLASVVMPLVSLLASCDDLSWSDRAKVSEAIQTAIRVHQSMAAESRLLSGQRQVTGINIAQGQAA